MKELLEYLEERYTTEEIWQLLDGYDEDYLRDYYLDNNVCPQCGGMVYIHRWDEKHEYWGSICFEPLSELKCENCGETY